MSEILTCNWQNVIDSIPCFCWGVLILITVYLTIKNCILPCHKKKFDKKIKEDSFIRELIWEHFKSTNAKSIDELKKTLKNQEIELELLKTKNELLKKQLDTYEEFMKKMQFELKVKEHIKGE